MPVDDTEVGNYQKNDSGGDMPPTAPNLLGNPTSDSSVVDSQLQKMDRPTANTLIKFLQIYRNLTQLPAMHRKSKLMKKHNYIK